MFPLFTGDVAALCPAENTGVNFDEFLDAFFADISLLPYQKQVLEKAIAEGKVPEFKILVPRCGAGYAERRFVGIWQQLRGLEEVSKCLKK